MGPTRVGTHRSDGGPAQPVADDRAGILLSSPALNRLLLVGSEIFQIHKAVNRELVGIVLSELGKRSDVRSKQRPAIVILGNAVIERGEDAPYPVGHPFEGSVMHHETSPLGDQTAEGHLFQMLTRLQRFVFATR
jgi:hypothetical protein